MKIPKTDKIIKAELINKGEKFSPNVPKTISFRTTEKSFYHFEAVRNRLVEKYGIDFSNTDVMEFALAFAYENFKEDG